MATEEGFLEKNYVDITYAEEHHPYTTYPNVLTRYLTERFQLKPGSTLLDVGCGRGEYMKGFALSGLKVSGLDRSLQAKKLCPEAQVNAINLENDSFPFPENSFDIVFNKSVIEHTYYPEKLVMKMLRVLQPNGFLITMTPDWAYHYKIFYEDFTHRMPFTLKSLSEILMVHGFKDVHVERFRQLPFLWKLPFLNPLCSLIAAVTPRSDIKLIRFSKEFMLLSTARK